MGNKIGIIVVEENTNTSPTILPSDLTNTGILFESERGPANTAIGVTSLSQDRLRYGDPRPTQEVGSIVKRNLFKNASSYGAQLYCVRVVGAAATTAATNFTTGSTEFQALAVGTTANSYVISVAAGTNSGTSKITIADSASTPTVVEVYDNLTYDILGNAINRGVTLGGDSTSGQTGHTDGTPSGLVSVVYVSDTMPDTQSDTAFSGGSATAYATATLTNATNASSDTVITAGQLGYDDPGAWGNDLYLTITPSSSAEHERDVTVEQLTSGSYSTVETWYNLTIDTFATTINDVDNGSYYIKVGTMAGLPDECTQVALGTATAGADATPSSSEVLAALSALDSVDIQLVTSADFTSVTDAQNLSDYAEGRKCLAVAAVDYGLSTTTIQTTWSNVLFQPQSFLALYRGWVRVDDENGGSVWVPPVGHVIGAAYITKMFQNGGLPSVAPAGPTTSFVDALQLEFPRYNDTDLETLVHDLGCNPTMFLPGRGFIVRTSRTMSSNSADYSAHVRRSINWVTETLKNNLGWVEQEHNDEVTQARVRQVLKFYFQSLFIQDFFETRGGYDNNVAVKCDAENNPMQIVNQRMMIVDIEFRLPEIAETIEIRLEHTTSGIVVTTN